MWFQFFSSDEDKALQQWEASVLSTPADTASTPESQKLPEALKWVREHYDPHQRAAELLADRGRSASVLSNASALRSPGTAQLVTPPWKTAQRDHTPVKGGDDDAMQDSDEGDSDLGSESDGLVGEEEMAGVEDLWMEHLQCVHTHGRHKLKVSLQQPCPANLISVVFTDQEVIEDLRGEEDDGEEPNIDISFVKFKGSTISIAPGSLAWKELFSKT